jgi:hypothetical protein
VNAERDQESSDLQRRPRQVANNSSDSAPLLHNRTVFGTEPVTDPAHFRSGGYIMSTATTARMARHKHDKEKVSKHQHTIVKKQEVQMCNNEDSGSDDHGSTSDGSTAGTRSNADEFITDQIPFTEPPPPQTPLRSYGFLAAVILVTVFTFPNDWNHTTVSCDRLSCRISIFLTCAPCLGYLAARLVLRLDNRNSYWARCSSFCIYI